MHKADLDEDAAPPTAGRGRVETKEDDPVPCWVKANELHVSKAAETKRARSGEEVFIFIYCWL